VIANRAGAQTDIVISAETVRDFGKMSPANVEIVDDPDASNGLAIEFTGGANNPPIPEPTAWFEVEFKAEAAEYFVWMRGKSNGDTSTDADWFQFDDQIGTANHTADPNALARGIGNWRDVFPAGVWIWSSQEVPPPTIVTVKFAKAGLHKLKVQPRQVPHRIDQIWFSQDQDERPEDDPVDWDPAIDPRLDLAPIDGGGVPVGDPRPVDSRGKLTTTWGRLKQKP
jgi:hypothetical protein